MAIRFGPAGIPIQCQGTSTIEGIECCSKLGLGAMEMEFVHGVRMKDDVAREAATLAKKQDISLSSHAPYYVNLCTSDEQKIHNSKKHIFESARTTFLCGGNITVFHPGFYQKLSKDEAFAIAKKNLQDIEVSLKQHSIKIRLGAETVGKKSAFGGLDENIKLSQQLEMVEPAIDFAHLHARGDFRITSEKDYLAIFDKLEKELGDYVKRFHCHFSEINYSDKGELNHFVLGTNNEPPFKPFMKVLAENGYSGTVICETPKLDLDALLLKKEYEKMKKGL
ncbi:endonuclease 4 [Candidatus Bilamarchaeum dharawalense]|uniref:Endonuclease 4 n=1 Tax=Candidatus Bilamarchaeum dharawalense TaxID=2885759 RepID=A0A5E4LRR8_9ARCH|nr:endonuclease 4 [Candidatus Bilamarchaeum dharawalense]